MRKGWEVKRLAECCEIVNGGTPKSAVASYWGGEHCWITPAEMGGLASPYLGASRRTITDAGLQNSSARLLPPQSVILSSRAPIGHLVINTVPMATNQGCKGLVPKAGLDPAFLYYCLVSMVPQLDAMGTGATFKELSSGKLKEVRIPVPPLAEQHRIVAILDEAFEGIAAARANAETSLRNARELAESATHRLLTGVCGDAIETSIGEEVDLLAGFAFKSKEYTASRDGVRLLRGDNIIPGSLRWEDVKCWPASTAGDYERFALAEDDVVLAMDRPWVSAGLKRARITQDDLPCLLVQRVARLRTKAGLDSRFLYHTIGTKQFIQHLLGGQTGTGVPHISGKQIADYVFAKPSLTHQGRAATMIDALGDCVAECETLIMTKLTALDELKASLLHQAFTGQL